MKKATSTSKTANRTRKAAVLATAALASLAGHAQAQSAGTMPGAGTLLQEIAPVQPALPSRSGTGLTILPEGAGAGLPASRPFEVKSIRIEGITAFAKEVLHALVADAEAKRLTLQQVGELAQRITAYYREHGYPLARAIIPPQTIEHGVVRIDVIEARYGKIALSNNSPVSSSLAQATLSPLHGDAAIGQDELDRALLLLSDIPGITVNATLRPGERVGTSDLVVDVLPDARVAGNLSLDNYGNRHTGRTRLGGTVQANNLLGMGDVLSAGGMTSGAGLDYARFAYDTLLNGQGTRAGVSYADLRYKLGDTLAPLDASGSARVTTLWLKHPLVRTRQLNLYGQLQAERVELCDHIGSTGIRNDRHLENWSLILNGDARDGVLDGGVTLWNLALTSGRVGFDDPIAAISDSVTAATAGRFTKWQTGLTRLQAMGGKNTLQVSLSAQQANGNLDPSQKMSIGGPHSVRAYDAGAVSGDAGYLATVEWHRDLGLAGGGSWQGTVFVDSARVTVNKNTWTAGENAATLRGAGVGLNWTGPQRWYTKAFVAAPIGARPSLVASTPSARAWVEIGKVF
jgi:hemolysin activation/secretion protein